MYWYLALFVVCSCSLKCINGVSDLPKYIPKTVEFTQLEPRGFKACIPHHDRIHMFAFFANINSYVFIPRKTNYESYIYEPSDGFWCFTNTQATIVPGDVLNYMYEVNSEEIYYRSFIQTKVFNDDKVSESEEESKDEVDYPRTPCQQRPSAYPGNQRYPNEIVPVVGKNQCLESLATAKKSIFSLIEYNAGIEKNLQDKKSDLEKSNVDLKYYKSLLAESFKIIDSSLKDKTNRLRLVTKFPTTDGYLQHVILNELGITTTKLDLVNIQQRSPHQIDFVTSSYGLKLKIYLTSRVKLSGQKLKMYDVDFE